MSKPRPDPSRDADALEVERLLRQLEQHDGHATPLAPRPPVTRRAPVALPKAPALSLPSVPGVWARVALGALLGAAMTQWPYADGCGAGFVLKVAATCVVVVAGVWAATRSWRRRMALAHVVALLTIAWGLGFVTHEVLPRTLYWPQPTSWYCPPAVAAIPTPPAAVVRAGIVAPGRERIIHEAASLVPTSRCWSTRPRPTSARVETSRSVM